MEEIYEPKKGFEDLFLALLKEYKREIQAISEVIVKQDQRSDETFDAWIDRKVVDAAANLEALAAKYKPLFRALSDSVTEVPKVK